MAKTGLSTKEISAWNAKVKRAEARGIYIGDRVTRKSYNAMTAAQKRATTKLIRSDKGKRLNSRELIDYKGKKYTFEQIKKDLPGFQQQFVADINKVRKQVGKSELQVANTVTAKDIMTFRKAGWSGANYQYEQERDEYVDAMQSVIGYDFLIAEFPEWKTTENKINTMPIEQFAKAIISISDVQIADPVSALGSEPLQLDSRSEKQRLQAHDICEIVVEKVVDFWNQTVFDEPTEEPTNNIEYDGNYDYGVAVF